MASFGDADPKLLKLAKFLRSPKSSGLRVTECVMAEKRIEAFRGTFSSSLY